MPPFLLLMLYTTCSAVNRTNIWKLNRDSSLCANKLTGTEIINLASSCLPYSSPRAELIPVTPYPSWDVGQYLTDIPSPDTGSTLRWWFSVLDQWKAYHQKFLDPES